MMKYFGTDGMRGTFGVAPINPFYFNVLAQALWYFYGGLKRVIMGRDTRISGEAIRQFLIDGFPQSVEILDGGILTSPLLSRSVEHTKSDLGLMITASHNPAADNGVKIFDRAGMKLPQRDEEGIETVMDEIGKEVRNRGHRIVGYEVSASYTMGDEIFQKFDKVVIDCANGAAIEFAKKAYRFPEVEWLGVTPDGSNINAHCGSEYPSSLIEKVKDRGAHLGIAHDGDGDRLLLCDGKGKIIPGEAILGIIAIYLGCIGRLSNRKIVTTLMSNQGLERTLKTYDIGVDYVDVGDRNVMARMYDGGYNFGGENSGHVIFRDEAPTSDGIQTALLFLKALDDLKISPEDAVDFVPLFPSLSCNINVREKVPLEELGTIQDEIETWRHRLGPNGKIFLRYSGTENRLRLLVEGEEEQLVQQIVKEMRNTIESCEKII